MDAYFKTGVFSLPEPSLLTPTQTVWCNPSFCVYVCADDEEGDESEEDETEDSQDVSEEEGIEGESEEEDIDEGKVAPSTRQLATMDRRAYMDAVLHTHLAPNTYDACIH